MLPSAFWAASNICCSALSPDCADVAEDAYSKYLPNSSNIIMILSNSPVLPQYSSYRVSKTEPAYTPSSHLIS